MLLCVVCLFDRASLPELLRVVPVGYCKQEPSEAGFRGPGVEQTEKKSRDTRG